MTQKKSSWRSRTLQRLQTAVPKLKRLVNRKSKRGRKALLKLFEGQRRDILDGLTEHHHHGDDHSRVDNLHALLSLPLELYDLETCLHLGVAGALRQSSTELPSDLNLPPFELASIDADAEFLAHFVVGKDMNNASLETDTPHLDPSFLLDSLRTNSTSPTQATYKVGGMAQLTAVLLMVAQILIGAQLLKRRRKRARALQPTSPTSSPTAAGTGSNTQTHPDSSDPEESGEIPSSTGRGRSRSPGPGASARRRLSRSRSRSNLSDRQQLRRRSTSNKGLGGSNTSLIRSLSRSCSFDHEVPPLTKPPPDDTNTKTNNASSGNESTSSLHQHINGQPSSTHHTARTNGKNTKLASNEHDDNGTAETDSLSLSEGVPQAIKEDQRQHAHTGSHGPPLNTHTNQDIQVQHEKTNDVLALLSFEGTTRSQLEAGRSFPPLPTLPTFSQDKFALRMSKLKNELFHVQQEHKTKIQDSTHSIQLRYQETNQQYSELTKRLQNLTVAVRPAPRPKSPALPARAPSPQQVQAQAAIQANSQEQAKLLTKVASLQQDLQAQQDRHLEELHQREIALQQMKTKIQFLNQELERRVLHSQKIDEERVAQRAQEKKLFTTSGDVAKLQQQQQQLSRELQDTKRRFQEKERECQELLQRLRQVPPPSSSKTSAQNQADAAEHTALMNELEQQLKQQDIMNKRTFEMTQLLEAKRADIIERTNQLEQMSTELEKRRLKVEAMEAKAKNQPTCNVSTQELEKELGQLQDRFESQSLECVKLNEIVNAKSKQIQEKEKECLELTTKLEEMSELLRAKEAQIEQLEQDVQDKQDLAAQNEAITNELQVQQDLQEKMNQTTLQMIKLLEEKEQSNADLTNKLEALTEELNQVKD